MRYTDNEVYNHIYCHTLHRNASPVYSQIQRQASHEIEYKVWCKVYYGVEELLDTPVHDHMWAHDK